MPWRCFRDFMARFFTSQLKPFPFQFSYKIEHDFLNFAQVQVPQKDRKKFCIYKINEKYYMDCSCMYIDLKHQSMI
jgi:hypothetical protein